MKNKNRVSTVQTHHGHSIFYLTQDFRDFRREMTVQQDTSLLYVERPTRVPSISLTIRYFPFISGKTRFRNYSLRRITAVQ